ncbi:MAG: hypothetical protein KAR42_05230 [candidate division Zixibacteria bacterium]|nr:hypothetical protein [candidate division Zixibacteria bacterium]
MKNYDPLLFSIRPDHVFLTLNSKKPVKSRLMFYVANPNQEPDSDVNFINPDGLTPQDELPDIHKESHRLSRIFIWFPYGGGKVESEEYLTTAENAQNITMSPGRHNKRWHCKKMYDAKLGPYWILFPKGETQIKSGKSVSFILSNIVSASIPGMSYMYVKNTKLPNIPARRTELPVFKIEPVSITLFTIEPKEIVPGQSVELTWNTKNATSRVLSPNIGLVQPNGKMSVEPKQDTKFRLTAFGASAKGFVEATELVKFKKPGWYSKSNNAPWQSGIYESFAFKLDEKQCFLANHYNSGSVDLWSTTDGTKYEKISDRLPLSLPVGFTLQFCTLNGMLWGIRSFQQDVWRSPDGKTWGKVTERQQPAWPQRVHGASTAYNGRLWLMGGFLGDNSFNDVWCSEDGMNWVCMTQNAPWSPRAGMTAVSFNGRLWLLGGSKNSIIIRELWSTVDGKDWVKSPTPFWEGRIDANLLVFHDKLWLIGGGDPAPTNDMWVMDKQRKWSLVKYPIPWTNMTNMGGVVFNHMIWLTGGRNYSPQVGKDGRSVWYFIPKVE